MKWLRVVCKVTSSFEDATFDLQRTSTQRRSHAAKAGSEI